MSRSLFMSRVRTHGWLRGIRYSLGVALLYPVLNSRHKARLTEYNEGNKELTETLARANMSAPMEEARYKGTLADILGVESLSLDQVEGLNNWRQRYTREGFRRGAMLEALHIVRCDVPEEFHGPYMPVEER
jgi:hypothetical protein